LPVHTKLSPGILRQRGHAERPACYVALSAVGSAPNITAVLFWGSVVSVSVHGAVPPCPYSTRLSRGVGHQRGHVPPPVAALGANGTSPLCFLVSLWLQSVATVSTPWPACTRLSLGYRSTCGARPLRPPAALLHKAPLPSMPGSRCASASLGAGHRFAPYRVKATGLMQSGLRWCRSHARRCFPVACAPYAPPDMCPCGFSGTLALVRRCARVVCSVACGQSLRVSPRPPAGPRRCAALAPARSLPVRPPRGLPQPAQHGSRPLQSLCCSHKQVCGSRRCVNAPSLPKVTEKFPCRQTSWLANPKEDNASTPNQGILSRTFPQHWTTLFKPCCPRYAGLPLAWCTYESLQG
jgi:hypothetical protein